MKSFWGTIVSIVVISLASVEAQTVSPCAYSFGLIAKDTLNVNGNNLYTNSFDSTDTNKSTNGTYDYSKRQANGNIAVGRSMTNSVGVGNENIYGSILTDPAGVVGGFGSNGLIGTFTNWATTVYQAEAKGFVRHDCNVVLADVILPSNIWNTVPGTTGSGIGGITRSTTLNTGYHVVNHIALNSSDLGDTLTINGNVRLWVQGNVDVSGLGKILVNSNSSLRIYVASAVNIAGQGVVNASGNASNAFFYGLPSSTSWSITGNGQWIGVIYAPEAAVSVKGGASIGDMSGGIVASTLTLSGQVQFHFDEALGRQYPHMFRPCAGAISDEGIASVQPTPTNCVVRFPMTWGKSYALEYCDNLAAGIWWPLATTNAVSASGEICSATDSISLPSRFYHLAIRPLVPND